MIKMLNLPKTIIMDIQADISWIRSELIKVQDPELITAFKSLLKYRKKKVESDWWDEISTEERAEIQEGIEQIEAGDFLTHQEVMANPRR
jgi:hypothetical protein